MKTILPGFYRDWSNDLLVVYPDMSFEYWGGLSSDGQDRSRFYFSQDQYLLECFLDEDFEFLGKL